MVFIPTTRSFQNAAAIVLPDAIDATLLANGVSFSPLGGTTAIQVTGGSLRIRSAHMTGATGTDQAAIECSGGGRLNVEDSTFHANERALAVQGCEVDVQRSTFSMQEGPAIYAFCEDGECSGGGVNALLVVERSLFEGNYAVVFTDHSEALFRNNILNGNGAPGYVRVVDFKGAATFSYNTLYRNGVSCTYVGMVNCGAPHQNSSNILMDSFPNETCQDQAYIGCVKDDGSISHSLNEIPWPGVNNSDADPMLTDPEGGDFTPLPGSPAIDAGEPDMAPEVDFFGNPRNVGDGPDIGAIEVQ